MTPLHFLLLSEITVSMTFIRYLTSLAPYLPIVPWAMPGTDIRMEYAAHSSIDAMVGIYNIHTLFQTATTLRYWTPSAADLVGYSVLCGISREL